MNILYWMDGFPPRIGGIETQGLCLVKEMHKLQHNCFVVANQDTPDFQQTECSDGIDILRFDFSVFTKAGANGQELLKSFEEKFMALLNKNKPDIIHLFLFLRSNSALLYLLLIRKLTYPVVLTLHSVYEEESFSFVKGFLENAQHICCVSDTVLKQVEIHLPNVMNKTTLISNALPEPALLPITPSFTPPIFLCIGRLSGEKGFDLAIQAFAEVLKHAPEVHLIIAGSGPKKSFLEKIIADLKISASVTLTGSIAVENIPALINQSSIVLMPSRAESFGLVALEAAQMERPIIASAVGGLLEVVEHQKSGLLVPADNVDELYKAMMWLLENPAHAIKIGKYARVRALKKFSVKRMIESYQRVYSQLTQNKTTEVAYE